MNQLNQQPVFSAAYGSAGYKWPTRLVLIFLLGVVIFFPSLKNLHRIKTL
jgi:hypothetical protein